MNEKWFDDVLEFFFLWGHQMWSVKFWAIVPHVGLLGLIITLLILVANCDKTGSRTHRLKKKQAVAVKTQVLATRGLLAIIFLDLVKLIFFPLFPGKTINMFAGHMVETPYTLIFQLGILITSAIILISSKQYLRSHYRPLMDYASKLVFVVFFLCLLVSSTDLLLAIISIFGFGLNVYGLILTDNRNKQALAAAFEYYYLSGFASALIAFGTWLTYLYVQETLFFEVGLKLYFYHMFTGDNALRLFFIFVFLLFGVFFKLAAFPCHLWAPRIYEASPFPITAVFIMPVKIAMLGFLCKLLFCVFAFQYAMWSYFIWLAAVGSMFFGGIAALTENRLKTLLAYASTNQMGFLLFGFITNTILGVIATLIYLFIYGIMNAALFIILLNTLHAKTNKRLNLVSELQNFAKYNRSASVTLVIVLFSMAGIPPLAGFFGKLYLLLFVFSQSYYSLVILGMLASLLSAFYYLKLIRFLWFDDFARHSIFFTQLPSSLAKTLSVCECILVFFFIWNNPILTYVETIAYYFYVA